MAVQDWNSNPALNTTIDGVNIAEGCPPANMNDMGRRIMASVRVMYDNLPVVTGKVDAAGGVFSGTQPIYTGRGAYLHHNDSANVSGRVYLLPDGSANPTSPSSGDIVLFYTP
jgi:hypothetical protein